MLKRLTRYLFPWNRITILVPAPGTALVNSNFLFLSMNILAPSAIGKGRSPFFPLGKMQYLGIVSRNLLI